MLQQCSILFPCFASQTLGQQIGSTGESKPDGWRIDRADPIPNKQGSPDIFADAQFGV
jgi:hypothetical protein